VRESERKREREREREKVRESEKARESESLIVRYLFSVALAPPDMSGEHFIESHNDSDQDGGDGQSVEKCREKSG